MSHGIIALFIIVGLLLSGLYLFNRKQKGSSTNIPHYYINISLLLPVAGTFNAEVFTKAFNEKWGTSLSCIEHIPKGEPEEHMHHFHISNGKNNLMLSYSNKPMEQEFTQGLMETNPYLTEKEIQSVQHHKAFIVLDYMMGTQNAFERLSFTSQLLLSLLKYTNAAGYINWSSKCYRQASFINHFYHLDYQDIESLFSIFINIHKVFIEEGYWIHTHGMEQFELPDIQIKFANESDTTYYSELLSSMVMYTIEKRAVLKIGDTAELAGDGVIYKITSADTDPEHPYGAYGAIELLRQN